MEGDVHSVKSLDRPRSLLGMFGLAGNGNQSGELSHMNAAEQVLTQPVCYSGAATSPDEVTPTAENNGCTFMKSSTTKTTQSSDSPQSQTRNSNLLPTRRIISVARLEPLELNGDEPDDSAVTGPSTENEESSKKIRFTQKLDIATPTGSAPSLFSPQSPSSAFSKTTLRNSTGCMFSAILLSQWDNILGPKIRHLWTTEETSNSLTLEMLTSISTHSLSGEICRDPYLSVTDTRLYVMKDKQLVVATFVFGAMGLTDMAVHSLSLLLPHSELARYLRVHELCSAWIKRLIGKLRVLLEKGPTWVVLNTFTGYLSEIVCMLQSLHRVDRPQRIPVISNTAFHPEHKMEETFLRRAIASHLMTCGHTIVTGQSRTRINLMIETLSLFLSPAERLCSRLVTEDNPNTYHPGLSVQGLLKDADGRSCLSIKDILYSNYPTTLVDMNTREVRRSSLHKHRPRQHEMLQTELSCVWHGQEEEELYPQRNLFHDLDEPETLVRDFMDEIMLLHPACGVRESYVEQFLQKLNQKAVALIQYVGSEMGASKMPSLVKRNHKKLQQDLGLYQTGDFKIVLASAEKLHPGIYSFLCGDMKYETEQAQNVIDPFMLS